MADILVRKLTIKSLQVTKRPIEGGPSVHVGRIVGEANGSIRPVTTQFGITHEFAGSFAGVSLVTDPDTGEIVERTCKSNKCFLPSVGEALLLAAVEGGKSVRFGFDVFINYRQVGGNDGFEYEMRSLFEPREEDAMSLMLKQMPALPGSTKAKQLSLVAPVEAEVKVENKQPEAADVKPEAPAEVKADAQPEAPAEAPKTAKVGKR
jgi:hypothetical protein